MAGMKATTFEKRSAAPKPLNTKDAHWLKGDHDPSAACRKRRGTPVGMTSRLECANRALVLRSLLDYDGVGLADVGIVNLAGIELQIAFENQIHGRAAR